MPKRTLGEAPQKQAEGRRTVLSWLAGAADSAAFAYTTIFLLQLKFIWGIWLYRDLTSGDTSSYFVNAFSWYRTGRVPIPWSPLYTSFYGSLLHLSRDAYTVTILHRMLIVLGLALMVLAVMRRLLPSGFAWLATAWWVALPIDFDPLYEVHLFAVIPVLTAVLSVLWMPGRWGRGIAIGVLSLATVLMRNELLLATAIFAVLCVGWEARQVRKGVGQTGLALTAYGLPTLAASLLILFSVEYVQDDTSLREAMDRKHTLNVCQVYAFGYQQRASDWRGSPWTECQQLMSRDFGVPEPSLLEAMRRNPRAMGEHFWWNVRLIPSGLQVLLFDSMYDGDTPDYAPTKRARWVLPATLAVCALVTAGLMLLFRERKRWWDTCLKDRVWAWIALGSVSLVAIVVMVTQRPRPSYLFALGIALRAVIALCAYIIVARWPRWNIPRVVGAAGILVFIFLAPPRYTATSASRPLLQLYRRLSDFEYLLTQPNAVLVTSGYGGELCNYAGKGRCRPLTFADLRAQATSGKLLHQVLADAGATVLLADEHVLGDPQAAEFLAGAGSHGWKLVAMQEDAKHRWRVLRKVAEPVGAPAAEAVPPKPDKNEITRGSADITLGKGWHGLESFNQEQFRWVGNDAEIELSASRAGGAVHLTVESGPSLNGKPLTLQVFGGRRLLRTFRIEGRRDVTIQVPRDGNVLRLHTNGGNKPIPNDPRILNFRVLRIWTE